MPGDSDKVLGSVLVLAFAVAVYRAVVSRRNHKVLVRVTGGIRTFIWIQAKDSNYRVMCKLSDALAGAVGMPHRLIQVHNANAERSIVPEILELDVPMMVVTLLPLRTRIAEEVQWRGELIMDPWGYEPENQYEPDEEDVLFDEVINKWENILAGAAWQAP